MAADLTYPLNIKQYSHVKITARTYALPDADIPGNVNKKSEKINDAYFYIPTGLTQGVSSSWSSETPSIIAQNAAKQAAASWGEIASSAGQIGLKMADKYAPGTSANIKSNYGAFGGKTMKPTTVLVLDEVGRYAINLNFDLTPQSQAEGQMVMRIIESFRNWSQPTLDTSSGKKVWMEYPPIFDIFVQPQTENSGGVSSNDIKGNLFYYENMVLEGYSAVHGGGANEALFYNNGVPIQTTLSLNFKSIRPGWNTTGKEKQKKGEPWYGYGVGFSKGDSK